MKNYLFSMLAFLFAGVSMQAEAPICGAPTNVQIQRISNSTAMINAEGGSLYDIYINVPGANTPSATTGPNHGLNDLSFPYTSNILKAQFGYHVWVRSQCSGETSDWVGPFVVEQYNASCSAPANISITRTSDTEATVTADAGIYDVFVVAEGAVGPSNVWTGPNVHGENDVDLSTPYTRTDLVANVAYDVYFRTQCSVSQVTEWIGPYNIPVYSAPCETPLNVVVTRTSDTSATITADDLGGTYDIYAVIHGGVAPSANAGPNTHGNNDIMFPFSRTDLDPTIEYDIYVRMDCGANASEWVGPFHLPLYSPTCVAPNASDVVLTRTSGTTATIDGLDNSFTYQGTANLAGLPLRDEPMYGMDAMTMPHTQYGLVANFEYDLWLRTDCGNGVVSEWTGPLFLGTYANAQPMKLYPNPAVAQVRIEGTQAVSVQVIGMSGKVELSTKVVNNEINLDGLAPGQYIIQATDAQGNVTTSKLMKK